MAQLQPAHVIVSSKHRTRGSGPGEFTVAIRGATIPPTGAYISLERCVLPLTLLDFPADVQYYWREYQVSPAAGPIDHTSTLPAGNYNAISFCALLEDEFNASSAYGSTAYTVTWDSVTGLITVRTGSSNYRWGLTPDLNARSFLNAIGMEKPTPDSIVLAQNVPEIGPQSILINCESLALDSYSSDPGNTASSLLAVVPLEGSPWETYVYSPPVPARYFIRQQISSMAFRITRSDDNTVIDLRGSELEMHFLLERE